MQCDWARATLVAFGMLGMLAGTVPAMAQQRSAPRQRQDPLENNIDRWNRMTPEERERELAKLPPARARMIRQRLHRYNQMNPEEQQALRERYQTFLHLPPAQQQIVRERLSELRQLAPGRRSIVHGEVQQLRSLPEAQRQTRLQSEEFRHSFNSKEQRIIHDLTQYLDSPK